jgi:hypothetical protein
METIKLDGREFHGITQSLSASQDDYILGHLRAAGALEIIGDLDGKKRTSRKRAEDLLTAVMLAGRTYHVIAGCLTENGKKWTREEAERNAAQFAEITDEEEKQGMRVAITRFVIGFFQLGEPSSMSSPKSSRRPKKARDTSNAVAATSDASA